MLVAWMGKNNTSHWPVGIKIVHFAKNISYKVGIGQSPYSVLGGMEAKGRTDVIVSAP